MRTRVVSAPRRELGLPAFCRAEPVLEPADRVTLREVCAAFARLAAAGLPLPLAIDALQRAHALRVPPERMLLADGVMTDDAFYSIVAAAVGADFAPAPKLHGGMLRQAEIVAAAGVAISIDGEFVVAPESEALVRLLALDLARQPLSSGLQVTTPRRFRQAIVAAQAPALAQRAAHALPEAAPHMSSWKGGSSWQLAAGAGLLAVTLAFGGAGLSVLAVWLAVLIGPVFLWASAGRLEATLTTALEPLPLTQQVRIPDADLPVYSIIVAAYREANVIDDLLLSLSLLDYPRAKLDVKIVLEIADTETLDAFRQSPHRGEAEALVTPDGKPRTKPRALNFALPLTRGEFAVVFDAEDRPEPDQLRKAVAAFRHEGADMACLQARLEIDNSDDGWLAACFALEYAALFGAVQPGMARNGSPIFLGGSSNHFRVNALRRSGAWDAWNVTEDADLGVRFARLGFRVGALDSATAEEAPNRWSVWLPQRVRWLKGWIQTAMTHTRHPAQLIAELGLARGSLIVSTMAATVIGPLVYPLALPLASWLIISGRLFDTHGAVDLGVIAFASLVAIVGMLSFALPCIVGAVRIGAPRLLLWLPVLPIYYFAVSYAAWRAVVEQMVDPQRWNKTTHGLSRRRRARPDAPVTGNTPAQPSPSP